MDTRSRTSIILSLPRPSIAARAAFAKECRRRFAMGRSLHEDKCTERRSQHFFLLLLALAVSGLALAGKIAFATDSIQPVNTTPERVAIKGYDTVAYFTDGQPKKGQPEYQFVWRDARWLFASAQHKDQVVGP
jgi:hypothetical protein